MAINFDALPTDKPTNLLPNGFYRATITEAKMVQSKSSDTKYLALTLSCDNGKVKGKVWDNFFDVDKELPRYKLRRLIEALQIPLQGTFELADLAKIVANKQLVVDIGTDEKSQRPRNQVEVFKNDIYYPINEWAALIGGQTAVAEKAGAMDAVEDNDPFVIPEEDSPDPTVTTLSAEY